MSLTDDCLAGRVLERLLRCEFSFVFVFFFGSEPELVWASVPSILRFKNIIDCFSLLVRSGELLRPPLPPPPRFRLDMTFCKGREESEE